MKRSVVVSDELFTLPSSGVNYGAIEFISHLDTFKEKIRDWDECSLYLTLDLEFLQDNLGVILLFLLRNRIELESISLVGKKNTLNIFSSFLEALSEELINCCGCTYNLVPSVDLKSGFIQSNMINIFSDKIESVTRFKP